MAIVNKKRISWTPALDTDIVEHKVFVVSEGSVINPLTTPSVSVPAGTNEIFAPDDFPAGTFAGEGNYVIGIASVDDVGNMSDVAVVTSPFDFIAPGAPTDIIVEDV